MIKYINLLAFPSITQVHILHGCLNLRVAHVALERNHVAPQFDEVGTKGVPGGMRTDFSGPPQMLGNLSQ
nr:hypothetical protein A6C57_24970 [Fibrella sp. ES10-3-2-2]